eukprot:CAMPEP_0174376570 /NCGR_PEP_ID=MMETSP0811_2-20130205/118602_1 /TAXON_ID=73025 ORGANISM="Eutreptiella gymnastica-like, Strain CCMP1594" /NCGR_SAMPLE_ID=MMETSP0811_2 /ASSEMBLY_ACC=CAM_ASM_000667 /LENGTH=42 /DNA_ID= /DNA_START= /DNA_END= /DNA_ORIENTATION=
MYSAHHSDTGADAAVPGVVAGVAGIKFLAAHAACHGGCPGAV